MSYEPTYDGTSLELYIGTWGSGIATAGSHNLTGCIFPVLPGQSSAVQFTPADVGCPIAIVGAGPVDPLTPGWYGIQGSTFHTTIASYVSPSAVTLTDAPPVSFANSGVNNIAVYRLCATVLDSIQYTSSVAPGTRDTLSFATLQSYDFFIRNQNLNAGQPVYLKSTDPSVGDIFGGLIDILTVSNQMSGSGSGGSVSAGLTAATNAAGTTPFSYSCQCASWDSIAARRVVQPERATQYTQLDAAYVFNLVVVTHLNDEGIAFENDIPPITLSPYVSGLPLIDLAVAAGAHIDALLNQIVSSANANDPSHLYFWYTDEWRVVHLSERSVVPAPWQVDDTVGSDSNVLVSVQVAISHNQLANDTYVVAAAMLANQVTVTFKGDGTTTTFNLPSAAVETPNINLNGFPQTVGVFGVDVGMDWYWSQGSTAITQGIGTVLVSSDALAVTYQLSTPGVGVGFNDDGLADRVKVEGTGALYQSSTSYAQPISMADLLGLAESLSNEYGTIPQQVSAVTLRPALKVGQFQTIKLSDIGVSGSFLISTLTMSTTGNVITWAYTAINGSNIGNWVTGWANFINRGEIGLAITTPTTAIASPSTTSRLIQSAKNGSRLVPLAFPSPVTEGNLLVVIAERDTYLGNPPAISDTMGNVWNQATWGNSPAYNIYGYNIQISILWALAKASGPTTISMPLVAGTYGPEVFDIAEFSGIEGPAPLDGANAGSSSSAVPTVASSQANDVIITGLAAPGTGASATAPETVIETTADSTQPGLAVSWLLEPSAGTFASSLVGAGSTPFAPVYATAAFKSPPPFPVLPPVPVLGNPSGTVTHSAGGLTADEPVFGNGGGDIKVGTKTGNTDELVTATGTATSGAPLLYDASGNAIAGSKQGNTTELQCATGVAGAAGAPLLYDASGNAVKGTVGQLVPAGGTTGQVLEKNSNTDGDTKWGASGGGVSVTTKGDLQGYDTAPDRIPVGSNTQVLTADSTQALGVKWAAPPSSSVTTKGDLQGYDTAPDRVPIGADATVLTADSSQALGLKWATPSTGSLILLEQHTASSSASLNFTTCLSSTYDEYIIEIVNVLLQTAGADLWVRMNTGSGFDAGANYGWAKYWWDYYPSFNTSGNAADTKIPLTDQTGYTGNTAASSGLCGSLRLYSPLSAVVWKRLAGTMNYVGVSTLHFGLSVTAAYQLATALTAFQILASSGNLVSGTVRVYGLAK